MKKSKKIASARLFLVVAALVSSLGPRAGVRSSGPAATVS